MCGKQKNATVKRVQPWDARELSDRVMTWATGAAEAQLSDRAAAPRAPGAYLISISAKVPLYAPLGGEASYTGSAADLAERAGRHRLTLRGTEGLSVEDCRVTFLPTDSYAEAVYVEALLIRALQPVLCLPVARGFGSKAQGRSRVAGQRPTPFDHLHPGRDWARRVDPLSRARTVTLVAAVIVNRTLARSSA